MPRSDNDVLVEFRFESVLYEIGEEALVRLVRQSWRNNVSTDLTGEIAVEGRRVRQVVEGGMETVMPLAARILADPRHTSLKVSAFGLIVARRHSGWHVRGLEELPAAEAYVGSNDKVTFLHSTEASLRTSAAATWRTA